MTVGYIDEAWRKKRKDETDLQWRLRVMQEEQDLRDRDGPIITPEAEQHGDYHDTFVMHTDSYTLARTKRNAAVSPIEFLHRRGAIDSNQLEAAEQIEIAHSIITRGISIRGANFEARVDNSGAGRDVLIEQLAIVRLEVTYSKWRRRVKQKPAMILAMLTGTRSLFEIARGHKTGWPRARQLLIDSLDAWLELRDKVARDITQDDVDRVYSKLVEIKPEGGLARE